MGESTIASIATASGASGIGIVRISGAEAVKVADRFVVNASHERDLTKRPANSIRLSYLVDADGRVLDEMLVSVMKAPFSYTGEDVVELNTHGGHFVLKQALSLALQNGAHLAKPGEFTKRAFLNGRIDLSRAEAVMDIISAENNLALENAAALLSGALYDRIDPLRKEILHESAMIEAALDDPEHFSLDGYSSLLSEKISSWEDELNALKDTFSDGKHIKEGIPVAIAGEPNSGKSSLLNALLKEERAIVTDIAGTTRDTIEEKVNVGGVMLRLTDTAGITDTDDVVERIGIERAVLAIEKSEIVFYVIDSSVKAGPIPDDISKRLDGKKVYALLNKSDLASAFDKDDLDRLSKALPEGSKLFRISALTGDGLKELAEDIRTFAAFPEKGYENGLFITNERHLELIRDALGSLNEVRKSIADDMSEDLFTGDLTDAYTALSSIIGEDVGEDLIDEIFSSFCMGK